jgi:ribosome-binding factor A
VLREEIADPRIGMLTITRVKLAADLSHAIVFWSPLAVTDAEAVDEMVEGLDSASGFVRRQLAATLDLRRTPAIHFKHDTSIAEGSHTLSILRSLPDRVGSGEDAKGGSAELSREEQNGEEA